MELNVGDAFGAAGTELGGKRNQTVDNTTDVNGISTLDETHVLRFAFNYQLPVGRRKKLLDNPNGWAMKVLDGVAGGWELAGSGVIRTGRPIPLVALSNATDAALFTHGNLRRFSPTCGSPAPTSTTCR